VTKTRIIPVVSSKSDRANLQKITPSVTSFAIKRRRGIPQAPFEN